VRRVYVHATRDPEAEPGKEAHQAHRKRRQHHVPFEVLDPVLAG
jgi:hypothetical protein